MFLDKCLGYVQIHNKKYYDTQLQNSIKATNVYNFDFLIVYKSNNYK